ncbi:MAG: hypothetical protein COC17_06610 [Hyphomicrobiales bacterium]|nr:MAG: hypothetical protein COC17_06610 [Hyphomicrobiales bacterium]
MQQKLRGDIFDILKKALKARGVTYAKLGSEIDLSEASVKRIFAEGDCKISRLLQICELLQISVDDIFERADRLEQEPQVLSVAIEAALAANKSLFSLFILLRESVSESLIQSVFSISENDIFLHARKLEKLGLIEIHASGQRYRIVNKGPIKFRLKGPLNKEMKNINLNFISKAVDLGETQGAAFVSTSRKVLPDTANLIKHDIEALTKKMSNLARQDQLIAEDKELETFKLVVGWAPIDFSKIMTIEPAKTKKRKI